MKRSKLSYDSWRCIRSKKFYGRKFDTEFFRGYIGIVEIEQVSSDQVWHFGGEDIVVCGKGMKWMSILPDDDYYCIRAMLNEKDEIVLWYIDIIAGQGVDADGIPYFDDLYLDLIVHPNGTIKVDDMDELENALSKNNITQEQFDLAVSTCDKLKEGLLGDIDAFILYTMKFYDICREMWK